MALPHVVTRLIEKRAQVAGELEHHQAVTRQLLIDLDAIDATLRLFDPDIALEEIRPKPLPPRHGAYKGEVVRLVLGIPPCACCPRSSNGLSASTLRPSCVHGGKLGGLFLDRRIGEREMRRFRRRHRRHHRQAEIGP